MFNRLEQLQKLKEEEFREKVEKETTKRAVKNLEVEKIKIIQEEKQMERERLAQEKNLLERREREVHQELERIQANIKETAKIYDEAEKRPVDLPQMAQKISDQENMRRRMFEEKTERIADLNARKNNLMAEKLNLDRIIEETRTGKLPDRDNVAKANDRIAVGAQKHLEDIRGVQNFNPDRFKEKIREDERRLENIKNGNYEPEMPRGMTRPMSKQMFAGAAALQSPNMYNDGKGWLTLDEQEETYDPMKEQMYAPAMRVLNERAQTNQNFRRQMEEMPPPNPMTFGKNVNTGQFGNQNPAQMQMEGMRQMNGAGMGPASPPSMMNAAPNMDANMYSRNRPVAQSGQNYMQPMEQTMPQQVQNSGQTATFGNPMMYNQPALRGDFDDFLTSNFVQNQMRNVDLNEDERMLVHLTMMEADSLRMLSRIPRDSELYRFKLEQYKELSTQRAEAEKLIQETKLRKMKRALDMRIKEEDRRFDNQRFVDDIRKQTTSNQLQKEGKIPQVQLVSPEEGLKDLNRKPQVDRGTTRKQIGADSGGYDPDHGFIIHWDYVFGIPKNQKFCQLVYAIRNGDEDVLSPEVVEPRAVRDQNVEKNQCIFYENNHIREIEPAKLTNLIVEVQMLKSLNNTDEYESLGWTFINLFDVNLELNRGKFKVPLYKPPIYQNITKEGVGLLKPVSDCSLLFRISYPWKDEYSNLKSNEPHINQRDYAIPGLHLKQASLPGVMSSNLFGEKMRPNNPVYQNDRTFDDDTVNDLPPKALPMSRRGAPANDAAPSTTTKPETPNDLVSKTKGFKVIIHKVADFKPSEKAKISIMVMSNQFVQRDDLDNDTRRSTTVHTSKGKDSNDGQGAGDKRIPGNAVSWEETFAYFLNVPKRVREDRKDIYLVMRVYETGEELTGRNPNTSATMQGYQLKGWYTMKLNEANGRLIVGSFQENLYSAPEKSPPFDPSMMTQISPSIEFTIEEITSAASRRKLD